MPPQWATLLWLSDSATEAPASTNVVPVGTSLMAQSA
jgi:hypothetical protein